MDVSRVGRQDGQYGAVRKEDRAAEEKGTKIMRLFTLRSPTRHLEHANPKEL